MKKTITINDELSIYVKERLDKTLSIVEPDISRSKVEKMIENGAITVNDIIKNGSYRLRENDVINYEIKEEDVIELKPLDSGLDIVFEDQNVLVINKPRGLVVHPAPGHYDDTLVNILIAKTQSLSTINGEFRPGIVHRIDKDTSGLLLVAKNDIAHAFLAEQLKDHSMSREYYAIVEGLILENSGKVIAPLARDKKFRQKMAVNVRDGREAVTYFTVLQRFNNKTLVSLKLETGRTHQIRVHMAYIGHPVLGDEIYGKKNQNLGGQILHAYKLNFISPTTKEEVTVETGLPQYFEDILNELK
ncbi:MAG: RluA family pseudouridine synthase [Bacilli bacterium]